MIPASLDFLLRTNADYGEDLHFADGDSIIDLTDLQFSMEVRRYPGGPLLFTVPVSVSDAANGNISITVAQTVTASAFFTVRGQNSGQDVEASHDIVVTHIDGFRETWVEGRVILRAGVTQDG